jgi:hypothetical protein
MVMHSVAYHVLSSLVVGFTTWWVYAGYKERAAARSGATRRGLLVRVGNFTTGYIGKNGGLVSRKKREEKRGNAKGG